MSSVEPVRMLDAEPHPSFELTELDAPEEELLGRYLPIGDVAKSIGVNPSVLRFGNKNSRNCVRLSAATVVITALKTWL